MIKTRVVKTNQILLFLGKEAPQMGPAEISPMVNDHEWKRRSIESATL